MLWRSILMVVVFTMTQPLYAKVSIQWEEPEVIPEALTRPGRRVLRFAGVTSPGTQIRIAKNKVKMMFSNRVTKWATIPEKHQVQFPVIASETGFFSFDLYLPTTKVSIPMEVLSNGRWRPYKLGFRVPESGQAKAFQFTDNFKSGDDGSSMDGIIADYDRKVDRGQMISERDALRDKESNVIFAWGGVGFSYNKMNPTFGGNVSVADPGSPAELGFPSWEIGASYKLSPVWSFTARYLSRNATLSEDGNYNLENKDFDWTDLRLEAQYNLAKKKRGRLGVVWGIHRQSVPFLKPTGGAEYRVFDNGVLFGAVGANYQMRLKKWDCNARAMLLYPFSSGSEFDLESGYGVTAEVSAFKELIPTFYVGGQVGLSWVSMETSYFSTLASQEIATDFSLWSLSPGVVLKTVF